MGSRYCHLKLGERRRIAKWLEAKMPISEIAGRMRLERHPVRVSHETIYRFAYSKDGSEEQFYRHLPEHRRRRRLRGYRRHNRTHIFDTQSV